MFLKKYPKKIKCIFAYCLGAFLVMSIAYFLVAIIIKVNSNNIHKTEIINSEEQLADVEKTIISNKVNRLSTDILYIADSLKLNDLSTGNYQEIEKQWVAFSDRKKIYDQIRYVDIEGNEEIKIKYFADGSSVTNVEELQNVRDQYYFSDTINLDENQIYIAKLELNIENNEIENPINPMLRLSTPYYGSDGKLKGIIILDYSANDMIQQVEKIASTSQGNIFMLNSNGYWIFNQEDSNKEWTFMYEDKKVESFQNDFPDEWKTIISSGKGYEVTPNGIFCYTNILTSDEISSGSGNNSIVQGEGDWYIVSHISLNSKNGDYFSKNILEYVILAVRSNIFAFFIILFLALIFAILMTINKVDKDKIKYFSEYDAMTGIYNRRAGFEKLNRIYNDAWKDRGKISICFIDINGLKQVNDVLGHEAGDELIISIINGIKINIRDNDFIARLGGDEFLIIFNDMDEVEAEKVWQRINEVYNKVNDIEGRRYIISASHGIVECKFDSTEFIDEIINHADEKMYSEKRIIKKELKVIRG